MKNIVQNIASLRIGKHRTEIASLRIGKHRIVKKETDIAHPQSRDSFWEPGLDFDICINLLPPFINVMCVSATMAMQNQLQMDGNPK